MPKPLPSASEMPNARFDFLTAAHEFMRDYPALKKNCIVIDTAKDKWYGHKGLMRLAIDDPLAFDDVEYGIKWTRKNKSSYILHTQVVTGETGRQKPASIVLLHSAKDLFFDPENQTFDDAATFDHEMTHLLIPNDHGTWAENAADARAVIRHFQRFGTDQRNIGYCGWRRAIEFLQEGEGSHLTTFVLDHVYNDKNSTGFDRMTSDETLQAAQSYATHYTPSDKEVTKLCAHFNSVAHKPVDPDFFREVARITLAAPDTSRTFYLGVRALMPVLTENGILLKGRRLHMKGAEWDDIRVKLEKRLQIFPSGHILPKAAHMRL